MSELLLKYLGYWASPIRLAPTSSVSAMYLGIPQKDAEALEP